MVAGRHLPGFLIRVQIPDLENLFQKCYLTEVDAIYQELTNQTNLLETESALEKISFVVSGSAFASPSWRVAFCTLHFQTKPER